jgi:ASC-1-like (ASCH) protein
MALWTTLNDPWFDLVRSGRKVYEGRRNIKAWHAGQRLTIGHHTEPQRAPFGATVAEVLHFPTFEAALRALPLERVLPGVATVEQGLAIYAQFVSLPTQLRDGVVMLRLVLD